MEILPDVFKFETGLFNWYLIRQNGRLTLVDAGFPNHYDILAQGVESIGHSLKDVEAIIITHGHADHTGFAERLRREINVPVYIHKNDAAMAAKPLQMPWKGFILNAWRPFIMTKLVEAAKAGILQMTKIEQTVEMRHEETLDVPGNPVILHTPGHTEGSTVVFLPDKKVLFSGDTLVTRNLLNGERMTPQPPSPILNMNPAEGRRSLDILKGLGQVTMAPGHGKPWTGDMAEAVRLATAGATH